MRTLLLCSSLMLLLGAVFAAGARATVFVTVSPAGTSEAPVSVSDSDVSGSASADIPTGLFVAGGEGTPGQTGSATAGIRGFPNALRFTNNGASTVTIDAGDVRARVRSSYTLTYVSSQFGGASSARCTASLSGKKGGTTHTVSASHNVSKTFNGDGELTGSSNVFNPNPGLGTITPIDTSLESLDMRMDLPGYVLAPGESLDVWVSVDIFGASTVGAGGASCNAQLTLLLEPGEALDNDAGVETPWVGPPPAVPVLGPMAGVLLVGLLAAAAGRRIQR